MDTPRYIRAHGLARTAPFADALTADEIAVAERIANAFASLLHDQQADVALSALAACAALVIETMNEDEANPSEGHEECLGLFAAETAAHLDRRVRHAARNN